jgi:hypothetical protein
MANRPSCRSCRHCDPPRGDDLGWCQLRHLPIHPELVADLWCHHWTARPPRLPLSPAGGGANEDRHGENRQLSLTCLLQEPG